jgi:hypothetical protein
MLEVTSFALGRRSASALFRRLEDESRSNASYVYAISSILKDAALRVPPTFYDELAERWTGPEWEANRKALDEFFQILLIRRDLQRELCT